MNMPATRIGSRRRRANKERRMNVAAVGKRRKVDRTIVQAGLRLGTEKSIGVGDCVRHPDNRVPTAEAIRERADSFIRDGQLEPIVVRQLEDGRYQIVSGETRWLAAKLLDWDTILGRVADVGDSEALELLAAFNAQRKDLNPIEKAQLIRRLCEPKTEGGAGLTREEAGKLYGFQTASAASNLVRLLELPKKWQTLVASGELPESHARSVLTLVKIPAALEAVWDDLSERDEQRSRKDFERTIFWELDRHTRAFTGQVATTIPGQRYPSYEKVAVKLNDENRARLAVVTVLRDGKSIEVATNVKAFDELQSAAVLEKRKRKEQGNSKKVESQNSLSPADKQQQFEKRIARWRHAWMTDIVASGLATNPEIAARLILVLFRNPIDSARARNSGMPGESWSAESLTDQFRSNAKLNEAECGRQLVADCISVVSSERDHDRPLLDAELLQLLMGQLRRDFASEWINLQMPAKDRLNEFFGLFESDRLVELGKELGVHLGEAKTKAAKIQLLTTRERLLPLPKILQDKRGKR